MMTIIVYRSGDCKNIVGPTKNALCTYTPSQVLSMFEANYPEAVNHVFLIYCKYIIRSGRQGREKVLYNVIYSAHTVPCIFQTAYNLVKNSLHERSRSRIICLDSEFTSEKITMYIMQIVPSWSIRKLQGGAAEIHPSRPIAWGLWRYKMWTRSLLHQICESCIELKRGTYCYIAGGSVTVAISYYV